ncbi:autotransporter [Leminorella grimontii]|uniref:Autotransporter n=1 Tax=Leminorella grimontii TaxID=82981 RepID=A0AAV5MWT4_9GAMM|nr:autotransporter outer membrane beta-barrel domain-containing protein [Leminorella grimontii]KFC96502.1 hypothetical protein GLGR_1678 [Leminorella grimontii ATCC 33999 = DSM 5078]GKX54300.1 autotransporter [Leminorella grimontii]
MNKIYRIIWNHSLGQWVVASEFSRGKKKSALSALKTALCCGVIAASLPIGNACAADYTLTITNQQTFNTPLLLTGIPATPSGLLINGAGDATFNAPLTVSTSGASAYAVAIEGPNAILTINQNASQRNLLETTGIGSFGVSVKDGVLKLYNTDVVTSGGGAVGVSVNAGKATLTDVSIKANYSGTSAEGALATKGLLVNNGGEATVTGGEISTAHWYSDAVGIGGSGATQASHVSITDTAISTSGASAASGVRLYDGLSSFEMKGGSITTTGAGQSAGVISDVAGNRVSIDGTIIRVSGDTSRGVSVSGDVTIKNADIKTTGASGYGIFSGSGSLNVSNTKIETGKNAIIGGKHNASAIYIGPNVQTTLDNVELITNGKNSHGVWINGTAPGTAKTVVTNSEFNMKNADSYGFALFYGNVEVSDSQITINSTGGGGIYATNRSSAVADNVTVVTKGASSHGVYASSNSSVNVKNSEVTTTGKGAFGVYASTASSAVLDGVDVTVSGAGATGSRAGGVVANGSGTTVSTKGGTITVSSNSADGVRAEASASAVLRGGTVKATGDDSSAVRANGVDSSIEAVGSTLETAGSNAFAVTAINAGQVKLDGAIVNTQGNSAHGAAVLGDGSAIEGRNLSVATYGSDAAGIFIHDASLSAGKVNLTDSAVNSAQSDGVLVSSSVGDITLTNASVSGSANALNAMDNALVTLTAKGSTLKGDLLTSTDSTANVDLSARSLLNGAAHGVTSLRMDDSLWQMTADSDVDKFVINSASVVFNPPAPGAFKTLKINTLSGNGGSFVLNTVLNEGGINTQTDKVHVTTGASGDHVLIIKNAGGMGALTVGDGIEVVQIDGASSVGFTLGNTVSAGAYEYLLYQGGAADADNWYLRSFYQAPSVPDPDAEPTPAENVIYRPEVAGYVAAPYLNQQYGFDIIGTYHERVGDTVIRRGDQSWARMGGQHRTNDADRFSYKSDSWFVQFGHDLYQDVSAEGTQINAGVMATLGSQDTDAQDRTRSLDARLSRDTGSVVSDGYSLGGYYTRMAQDGGYLDLVGQGTFYHNKYKSDRDATQNGYGIVASAEVGKPFALGGNMSLEPQLQLMYQYLSLKDFDDDVGDVDGVSAHAGLARGGLRLSYDATTVKPYVLMDVVQRLGADTAVNVGGTNISADLTDAWWQTGAGVSVQLAEDTQVYADAKYQRGFDGNMEGYGGRLGIKVSF